jgi:transcriptional regulator with XRE-family HTH domain
MSQIANRIRRIRLARGESQRLVAARADITVTTYSRIENGHNEPTLSTLRAIASALDVTVEELIADEPVPAA